MKFKENLECFMYINQILNINLALSHNENIFDWWHRIYR